MKTKSYFIRLFMAFIILSGGTLAAEDKASNSNQSQDKRYSLGLTPVEKADFLAEMRQMLTSIQGIMEGIGASNRSLIIKSARYSGNRMARETPQSVKKKTPPDFKKIGGPTHMKFEELAVRAEDDEMSELATLTADLMKNCLACHTLYKVD